jgi:hypothetical protein
MFSGILPNTSNLGWMRIMYRYLISLISVGDMGEKHRKGYRGLGLRTNKYYF